MIIERETETEKYFNYELTPEPTSLIKCNFMRHPDKSSLAATLKGKAEISVKRSKKRKHDESEEENESSSATDVEASNNSSYVLDGGALLHRVLWKGKTFGEVTEQYRVYVSNRYGKCTVVFDVYQEKTIKDHEHKRRSLLHQTCPDVVFDGSTDVLISQHIVLTNDRNKERFIELLATKLENDGHSVVRCPSDADTEIVGVALDSAGNGNTVTVVAEDTDIFVLLLYFWNSSIRSQGRISR